MKRTSQQTKELILNTATELFAIHGYDGLRVDEIASKAQVNKATIYYHFKDKNFIFETIIMEMVDKIFKEIEKKQKGLDEPLKKVEAFFDAISHIVIKYRNLAKIMMQELAVNGKNLSNELKMRFFKILEILINIVDEGIKKEQFKKVSAALIHTIFLGGLNYYLSLKETIDGNFPVEFEDSPQIILKEMILNYLKK